MNQASMARSSFEGLSKPLNSAQRGYDDVEFLLVVRMARRREWTGRMERGWHLGRGVLSPSWPRKARRVVRQDDSNFTPSIHC